MWQGWPACHTGTVTLLPKRVSGGYPRPCQAPFTPEQSLCFPWRLPTLPLLWRRRGNPSSTAQRPPAEALSSAPRTTWLAVTLALVFLLLISTAVNVSLLLGSRAERSRHLDGAYVYHPLQEMNGELLASEKEQPSDTHNPFKD